MSVYDDILKFLPEKKGEDKMIPFRIEGYICRDYAYAYADGRTVNKAIIIDEIDDMMYDYEDDGEYTITVGDEYVLRKDLPKKEE